MTRFDTVSFLTDYGIADEFVGVVKSVIRDIAPHVTVVDLTHDVAPFDVRAGSLALARCIGYVPSGVVLGVVDPGVGTDRRAVDGLGRDLLAAGRLVTTTGGEETERDQGHGREGHSNEMLGFKAEGTLHPDQPVSMRLERR